MAKERLAITGCAVLTPLDKEGGETTWQAMVRGGRVGAVRAVVDEFLAGEVGLDRSIRMALAVGRRAAAGLSFDDSTQLFCGTSKGPVGVMLAACERLRAGVPLSDLQARQVALGVGAMGPLVAEGLGIGGRVHTSVAACASGLHALHRAAEALWRGECERAVVVAADASLQMLFEGSFARLGVLAPADAAGVRRCEPFGEDGEGFFLVEAGAAIVLENSNLTTQNSKQEVIAWLEESWVGGDGTGLIAIDPKTEALRRGLKAGAGDNRLSFVHAHATGTGHDQFELEAIRAVLGQGPAVFSSKKWLGHSLGAAGLVSVALSVMSHQQGSTPGGESLAAGGRSLTVAQGFGGHIGVVRLCGAG